MDGLFGRGMTEVLSAMDAAAKGTGYRLYVIGEGTAPLAAVRGGFFPVAAAVMAAMFLTAVFVLYASLCGQYRHRIAELTGQKPDARIGWRLKRLREAALEIEYELTGENV